MKLKENMRIQVGLCDICHGTGEYVFASNDDYVVTPCPNCIIDPEPEQDDTREVLNA